MDTKSYLTRGQLMAATNVKHYTISYLTLTNKLPRIRKASGKGSLNLYDPSCIQILENYKMDQAWRENDERK